VNLTGRELVLHLFAPLDGPGAPAAADHLMALWRRCQRDLGMNDEILALGLPADLPDNWPGLGPEQEHAEGDRVAIAACTRRGPGVFQAVLRRHHDVAGLSVVLAPPAEDDVSWAGLDELWSRAAGELRATGLLGTARIHVGRLCGDGPLNLTGRPDAARVLAGLLPGAAAGGQGGQGAARHAGASLDLGPPSVLAGLVMWEVGPRPDGREERRIVLLGAEEDDARLSAFAWSRGTPEIPPFGRYLLHAAKVRYHLRVWAQGRTVRALRDDVEAVTSELARVLAADAGADRPAPGAGAGDARGPRGHVERIRRQLERLRAAQAHLVSMASALERMRLAVDIARWNMAQALDDGATELFREGLFRDDARLIDWFIQQLADDRAFVEASAGRARGIVELALEHTRYLAERFPAGGDGATRAESPAGWEEARRSQRAGDVLLTGEDREALERELAAVFSDGPAAAGVLDRIGLDRAVRPGFAGGSPQDVWRVIVTDLVNGRVDIPYRRLITAALADYPFNPVFLDLAVRYSVLV
jgi:hypothetical protein